MFNHGSYRFAYNLRFDTNTPLCQLCDERVCVGDIPPKGLLSHALLSPPYPQHHSHDKISQVVYAKVGQVKFNQLLFV